MGYTLAQVRWWSAAIDRARSRAMIDEIVAVRMVWADAKATKRVLKSLGAD